MSLYKRLPFTRPLLFAIVQCFAVLLYQGVPFLRPSFFLQPEDRVCLLMVMYCLYVCVFMYVSIRYALVDVFVSVIVYLFEYA